MGNNILQFCPQFCFKLYCLAIALPSIVNKLGSAEHPKISCTGKHTEAENSHGKFQFKNPEKKEKKRFAVNVDL